MVRPADADLDVVGQPSGMHHVAGGADGRADVGSQLLRRGHALFGHAHADADHHLSGGQFQGAVLLGNVLADERNVRTGWRRRRDLLQ